MSFKCEIHEQTLEGKDWQLCVYSNSSIVSNFKFHAAHFYRFLDTLSIRRMRLYQVLRENGLLNYFCKQSWQPCITSRLSVSHLAANRWEIDRIIVLSIESSETKWRHDTAVLFLKERNRREIDSIRLDLTFQWKKKKKKKRKKVNSRCSFLINTHSIYKKESHCSV